MLDSAVLSQEAADHQGCRHSHKQDHPFPHLRVTRRKQDKNSPVELAPRRRGGCPPGGDPHVPQGQDALPVRARMGRESRRAEESASVLV